MVSNKSTALASNHGNKFRTIPNLNTYKHIEGYKTHKLRPKSTFNWKRSFRPMEVSHFNLIIDLLSSELYAMCSENLYRQDACGFGSFGFFPDYKVRASKIILFKTSNIKK